MNYVINYAVGEIYIPKRSILNILDNKSLIHSFWSINPINEYFVTLENSKENIECACLIKDIESEFIKLSDFLNEANFIGKIAKSLDGCEILVLFQTSYVALALFDTKYFLISNEVLNDNFIISSSKIISKIDKSLLSNSIYKQVLGKGRIR